jgi:hypothetical protein
MTILSSISSTPTLSTNPNFSGHETFAFRYAWLKKGVDGLLSDTDIFLQDTAMVELGVGKNMVRSIRHWCLATRMFEENEAKSGSRTKILGLSELGRSLLLDTGWDPFLEDDASLWLIHWNLATNPGRATTWYWAFNLLKDQEFTREGLAESLGRIVEASNSRASANSIKADVSCFLRTYVAIKRGPNSTLEETLECPLATLGLISEIENERRYRFHNGEKPSLPQAAFCYALLDCWEKGHPGQGTLSLREIVHGEGSPGRVFRLDEDAALAYLDDLESVTQGRLRFQDTATVRQVERLNAISGMEVLNDYYQRH